MHTYTHIDLSPHPIPTPVPLCPVPHLLGRQVLGDRELERAPVRQGEEVLDERLAEGALSWEFKVVEMRS